MYRLWFEAPVPPAYASMLDGLAVPIVAVPGDPLGTMPGADALVVGVGVRYDGALMDKVPTLKVISRIGVGLDNVIVPDATARDIVVCYTPDAPTVSTAEHALALLFAVTKRIVQADRATHNGTVSQFMGS